MADDRIPEMENNNKSYIPKTPEIDNVEKLRKEFDKTKEKLEKFKNYIVKKYPYTISIGILPPQSIKMMIEEENLDQTFPKEKLEKIEKAMHLYMIIPEEKIKETPKIKEDLVKQIDANKELADKLWIHIKTPVDIWEACFDSKFDVVSAVAMSYPLHDKGFLGVLRITEIHKSLVLKKFEKYVVSYVMVGSLMRGEATKTSDADIFIVIDDTDVKRMSRLELKEKLRSIIHSYIPEAASLAGVKNTIHIQTYLLTDFWDSVKDAHPVIFTFIRDGVPLYDRGTFMPWKALLKMGKLKPSPEAVDMFMLSGEKTKEIVGRRMIDAMIDIYYGILNPSQALIMLYGEAPPTPKETVAKMRDIFVKKEKLLEEKYVAILEKAVKLFKAYEHEEIKDMAGSEIEKLLKESEEYMKRLKELRQQIEKRSQEKTIDQISEDIFHILEAILGKRPQKEIVSEFEKRMIKPGKLPPNFLRILNDVIEAKEEFKKGKSTSHKIDEARKNGTILINGLIEYSQRCDLAVLDKSRMRIKYSHEGKEKIADLLISDGEAFLFFENGKIKKITDKIEDSNPEEVQKTIDKNKNKRGLLLNQKMFDLLKKELGDYEILI